MASNGRKHYPPKARVSTKKLPRSYVAKQRALWRSKGRRAQLAFMRKHPSSVMAARYGINHP